MRLVIRDVVVFTAVMLMIPLIAMRFDNGADWTSFDFIVAGLLIAVASFVMDVVIRGQNKYKVLISFMIFLGFVVLWAQLSVGVVTQFWDGTLFLKLAQFLHLW